MAPASVGRGGDNHSLCWLWPSGRGKVVSQGTRDSERCLVSISGTGPGPTGDVCQGRCRTGWVFVWDKVGTRGGCPAQFQCSGTLACCISEWFSYNFFYHSQV